MLSPTQPAITAPLIRFAERGQMQGSYLDYLNAAKGGEPSEPLFGQAAEITVITPDSSA